MQLVQSANNQWPTAGIVMTANNQWQGRDSNSHWSYWTKWLPPSSNDYIMLGNRLRLSQLSVAYYLRSKLGSQLWYYHSIQESLVEDLRFGCLEGYSEPRTNMKLATLYIFFLLMMLNIYIHDMVSKMRSKSVCRRQNVGGVGVLWGQFALL